MNLCRGFAGSIPAAFPSDIYTIDLRKRAIMRDRHLWTPGREYFATTSQLTAWTRFTRGWGRFGIARLKVFFVRDSIALSREILGTVSQLGKVCTS